MKTQQTSAKSALATLTIIIMLAFTFSSCQKEETATPANSANHEYPAESTERAAADARIPAPGMAFITIDHMAVKSMSPDYKVTVYSNGLVSFTGRKNVEFIGHALLKVSEENMIIIKKLIANANFFNMTDKKLNAQDMPATTTTCSMMQQLSIDASFSYQTKSLVDYNNGYPRALYTLRTSIENQFPIKELIGKETIKNIN